MSDITLTPKKQAKILRQIDALRARAESAENEVARLKKENRNYDRNAQERGKEVERLRAALEAADIAIIDAAYAMQNADQADMEAYGLPAMQKAHNAARKALEAQ